MLKIGSLFNPRWELIFFGFWLLTYGLYSDAYRDRSAIELGSYGLGM